MKKSKLFMIAGTLALAVTAIFATKANKKFVPFTTALAKPGIGQTVDYTIKWGATDLFTSSNTGATEVYMHGTSVSTELFTATGGTRLYYR